MNSFNILKALCISGYVEIQRIHSRGLESDGLAGVLGVLMTGEINVLLRGCSEGLPRVPIYSKDGRTQEHPTTVFS